MTAENPPPSLKELEARLSSLRERAGVKPEGEKDRQASAADRSAMGLGARVGVELVVGVVGGGGIGWFLDRWLGTAPFLMLLFIVLGAAAGMLNIYRLLRDLDKNRPA